MIDGTNDADEQAERLVPIALRLRTHVNLIPLNPTPGWPSKPSPASRIRAFASILEGAGVAVTIRDTRGREIDAACGQLSLEHERAAAR
jgi:23S rRNA (adenine2503-C2)-methyltransferase